MGIDLSIIKTSSNRGGQHHFWRRRTEREGGRYMFESSYIEIDNEKKDDFKKFVKRNAKDKKFWDENKKAASREVDKEQIDKLFECSK